MNKFEYTIGTNLEESLLNYYGSDGWELVCVIKEPLCLSFYFKRLISK